MVVIQQRDDGTKERPYPHAIVAGIERYVGQTSSLRQDLVLMSLRPHFYFYLPDKIKIGRYPLKVTKTMGKKKVAKRSKVKPFIKVVNYAHLLPTRYMLELESLKGSVSNDTFKEPTQREVAKKAIKKAFEERYAKGSNRWCEWTPTWDKQPADQGSQSSRS